MAGDKDTDKWIISLLLAALTGVLWWLMLDTRTELTDLRKIVYEQAVAIQALKHQP